MGNSFVLITSINQLIVYLLNQPIWILLSYSPPIPLLHLFPLPFPFSLSLCIISYGILIYPAFLLFYHNKRQTPERPSLPSSSPQTERERPRKRKRKNSRRGVWGRKPSIARDGRDSSPKQCLLRAKTIARDVTISLGPPSPLPPPRITYFLTLTLFRLLVPHYTRSFERRKEKKRKGTCPDLVRDIVCFFVCLFQPSPSFLLFQRISILCFVLFCSVLKTSKKTLASCTFLPCLFRPIPRKVQCE